MVSSYECRGFTWTLQGQTFTTNVMTIPLGGCGMVLGVQWLDTLGNILWNFNQLRMEFVYQGHKMALRGTTNSEIQWLEGKKLKRMQGKKLNKEVNRVDLSSLKVGDCPGTLLNMVVHELPKERMQFQLQEYEDVIATNTTLLLEKEHEHQIVFKPGKELYIGLTTVVNDIPEGGSIVTKIQVV